MFNFDCHLLLQQKANQFSGELLKRLFAMIFINGILCATLQLRSNETLITGIHGTVVVVRGGAIIKIFWAPSALFKYIVRTN